VDGVFDQHRDGQAAAGRPACRRERPDRECARLQRAVRLRLGVAHRLRHRADPARRPTHPSGDRPGPGRRRGDDGRCGRIGVGRSFRERGRTAAAHRRPAAPSRAASSSPPRRASG
jgi:hypothetical protein